MQSDHSLETIMAMEKVLTGIIGSKCMKIKNQLGRLDGFFLMVHVRNHGEFPL